MITVVEFDCHNYDLWEIAVRVSLKAQNKLGFINGSLERPAEVEDEEFSECHAWTWLI